MGSVSDAESGAILTCRAQLWRGELCNSFIGYHDSGAVFVETALFPPLLPDGDLWVRCTNVRCRAWNHFEVK